MSTCVTLVHWSGKEERYGGRFQLPALCDHLDPLHRLQSDGKLFWDSRISTRALQIPLMEMQPRIVRRKAELNAAWSQGHGLASIKCPGAGDDTRRKLLLCSLLRSPLGCLSSLLVP
jgi:hypothetical protein